MPKPVHCNNCDSDKHYTSFCRAKKPAKAKKPVKKIKKPTRSQIVKKLDTVFSQYIRQSAAENGIATCVTCGAQEHWNKLQNGHFYSRGRYPTRWHEQNCNVQCVACNVFLKGNYIAYTKFMIDSYGREFVDELELLSKTTAKISTPELLEKIKYYKSKLDL